jgi:hypothetical protein
MTSAGGQWLFTMRHSLTLLRSPPLGLSPQLEFAERLAS